MRPTRPFRAGDGAMSPEALARKGYDLHGGELYRFALSRLSDDAAAQDAVQETVIRAWRATERFDPAKGSLRTWLFAIHRRVVIDQLAARGRASAAHVAASTEEGERDMDDETLAVVDADLITRALGVLSQDHRTAIVETYLRDRSYDEVAVELGVSVSTLRSRVFYGLKHLRQTMTMMVVEP